MTRVFLSYRRETAAGEARALFNDLAARLGKNSVFMDVDSIALGRDFRSVLQKVLGSCDQMLVIIDKDWIGVKDETGKTRLGDPSDYIRMEVEAALKRDIAVTPVLVKGAHMPAADQLPSEIKDLAYRAGFELSYTRWESDVREMMRRLGFESSALGGPIETGRPSTALEKTPGYKQIRRWHVWVVLGMLLVISLSSLFVSEEYKKEENKKIAERQAAAGFSDYIGEWTNADPNTPDIARLSVGKEGEKVIVRAWGRCHPTYCDWGAAQATAFRSSVESSLNAPAVDSVSATFSPGFAEKRLTLRLSTRDNLSAIIDTHFTDNSGRADYETTDQFVRASP